VGRSFGEGCDSSSNRQRKVGPATLLALGIPPVVELLHPQLSLSRHREKTRTRASTGGNRVNAEVVARIMLCSDLGLADGVHCGRHSIGPV
jgi:hypothetical protein